MKRVTFAAFAALVAFACTVLTPAAEATAKDAVSIRKYTCASTTLGTTEKPATIFGTLTRVGDAQFTAGHVLELCDEAPKHTRFPDLDLAIIEGSSIQSCREPLVNERVRFSGYPLKDLKGAERAFPITMEQHYGTVIVSNVPFLIFQGADGAIGLSMRHTRVEATELRGGYSGGAVTAAETGEFLGIISTGSVESRRGSFIPANVICEKLEEMK